MTPTLDQAMKLADQDCPLPSLAGPALKALRARVLELEGQQAARVDERIAHELRDEAKLHYGSSVADETHDLLLRAATALEAALSAQPAPERQERWRMTSRPAQTAVFLPLDTGVDCLACGHDTHPAVPVGVPDGVWGRYASWLLDHCEGEVITEESLQNWLADMLAAAPSAPQGTQQGEG